MSTQTSETNTGLQKAVDRLASRPTFLANLLSKVFAGDVSASRIAGELGCSEANALRLAMMRVPRPEMKLFREDLDLIAKATDVDRGKLLSIVKQAKVLSAFDADGASSMLLAARDDIPRDDKEV